MSDDNERIKQLLEGWSRGEGNAKNELLAMLYPELKRAANRIFASENPGHTLQATAVVNEAYERLVEVDAEWQGKTHFFNLSATIMRRILVDHARAKRRLKRGGDSERVTITDASAALDGNAVDILALDQALEKLKDFDPFAMQILEQRIFGGLTNEQIAEIEHKSLATIERKFKFAKAWLYQQLHPDSP